MSQYWHDFYNTKERYEEYDIENKPRLELAIDLIKKADKHLDVGCGTGLFTRMLNQKFPNSKGYGIDYVDEAITVANKLGGGKFLRADATQLPFIDGMFDLVFSSAVIAHLEEPQKAIDEIYRVLKPGGVLIMTLSNPEQATEGRYENNAKSLFKIDMLKKFEIILHRFHLYRLDYYVEAKKI